MHWRREIHPQLQAECNVKKTSPRPTAKRYGSTAEPSQNQPGSNRGSSEKRQRLHHTHKPGEPSATSASLTAFSHTHRYLARNDSYGRWLGTTREGGSGGGTTQMPDQLLLLQTRTHTQERLLRVR